MRTILFLLFSAWALTASAAPRPPVPINVATYNLRNSHADDGPNAWPARKDMVKALIRYHEFDIVGTQEAYADQVADLAQMEEFDHVGVGRDDGKSAGEHSAIFFRKSRFALLVFVDRHVDVLKYAALSDSLDRRYPSDHFPVVARVVFK